MRRLTVIGIAAVAAVGGMALSSVFAAGKGVPNVTQYAAATFTPVAESTHNKNGSSVCTNFVARSNMAPDVLNSENKGDLNAIKGSNLENVRLGQGVTVSRLTLFANDNDTDTDVHVFLVRKLLKAGLSPQFGGYLVMGEASSSGAVLNTMRRFSDPSIKGAVIDNTKFEYYLELVNCGTVEPFDVQIAAK